MLFFPRNIKGGPSENNTVLYLGTPLGLPRVIDQYNWNDLPEKLQLCYYDTIVLNLDSLANQTLQFSEAHRLPANTEFARALFWSKTEIIAFGNPNAEFHVVCSDAKDKSEMRKVSWWLPNPPVCSPGQERRVKTTLDGRRLKVFLDYVQETDWFVNEDDWSKHDDVSSIPTSIHPLGRSIGRSRVCLARSSSGKSVAFLTKLVLDRDDENGKISAPVTWLPALSPDILALALRKRFEKHIRTAIDINEILGEPKV